MFGMNDPFGNMNSMMNNFMQQGSFNMQQQQGGQNQRQNNDPFAIMNQQNQHMNRYQQQHQNQMQDPFAMMNQMMGNQMMMGQNIMGGNQMMGNQMMMHGNEPTQAVFSSSSVMTYSNSGDGKPKIYQASSQVRQGPGGVKETRQMLRDSEKGLEKVAVGHHIGDRAHIIERKKENGGDVEEIVNLENLDDDEVPEFNKEFETKLTSRSALGHAHGHKHHIGGHVPLAIDENKKKR